MSTETLGPVCHNMPLRFASLRFKAWKAGLVYNCRETSRVWLTGCLCVVITVIALVGRVLLAGQSLLTLKLTGA